MSVLSVVGPSTYAFNFRLQTNGETCRSEYTLSQGIT